MATTEWTVTRRVVIVLTTLCVTRPADTARRPVKHHSSLLSASHVSTNNFTAFILIVLDTVYCSFISTVFVNLLLISLLILYLDKSFK